MKRSFFKVTAIMLAASFILAGCVIKSTSSKNITQKGTAFMWEVSGKAGDGKLYLLGSIHAGKEDLYPLKPVITDAFEASDVLAVECDVTTVLQRKDYADLMKKVMYTDGTTIKDHISSDLYDKVDVMLKEHGLSISLLAKYKPFMIASTITSYQLIDWGYKPDDGIDISFINLAREQSKEIAEIESVDFQYDLLGGFSDQIQELELRSTVEGIESSKTFMDDMFQYWIEGDVKKFEDLTFQEDPSFSPEEKAIYKEFEKQMFDDRNINMAAKAEEYLKSGKTYFFVVGSGHMVGDAGIVNLLRDKGYTVIQK